MGEQEVRMRKPIMTNFDGMAWPIPNANVSHRMRYGQPTREDQLQAASEMDAYAALLVKTQKQRNHICKMVCAAVASVNRQKEC